MAPGGECACEIGDPIQYFVKLELVFGHWIKLEQLNFVSSVLITLATLFSYMVISANSP